VHFHFSTVVWGPWHTGVFLEVNLPSLLAPGNLEAFAARHEVTYRIFTSRADVERIKSTAAFERASKIVPFEFIECPVEDTDDPIGTHHLLWRRSIIEAEDAGAMVLFVPPDVIWANGSFGHVAELAARGKRAIFITYMRVIAETCVPETRRRHLSADGAVLDASADELTTLLMEHIHPLTLTYLHDSPNFPIHPEFILWSVPGEGFLMRVLVREMFCYDPALIDLNQQALPAHPIDPELIHYINDSDDLFSLSLAPLKKDVEWYADRRPLSTLRLASWWLTYDSPANDIVVAHRFYMHVGPRTPSKWRPVELQSDALIRRTIGTREILRTIGALADDFSYARQVLSLALAATKLPWMISRTVPVTLLLPTNTAVLRWIFEGGEDLLREPRGSKLVRLILGHVVIGRVPQAGDAVLTTVGGGKRRLTWRGERPFIDGVEAHPGGFAVGQDWSYGSDAWGMAIEAVLPPATASLVPLLSENAEPAAALTE
jgi:hypothetical protein